MTKKTKRNLLAVGGLAVLVAVALGLSATVDWHRLRVSMETMSRGPLLATVAILPLFGFSISVVYLVVGAVFGGWLGLAVVGGASAIHLVGSHWIARSFLRGPVERFMKRHRHHMPVTPQGEEWSVALMTALIPGLPYFARNYLLALSGIPLRSYFWICWPVYVVRSCLVLFLGDFSEDFSAQRVGGLAVILTVKVAICAYLLHRLRARHKARHGVATASPTARKRAA